MKNLTTKTFAAILAGMMFAGFFSPVVLANRPEKNNDQNGRYEITMPPKELNLAPFYKKYVNVNGIHIMSSHRVPDSAFVKACEIIDFMTGGLPAPVLNQMAKVNTRVGIMARYE